MLITCGSTLTRSILPKGYKDVGKAKPDSTELDLYVPPDYDQLNSSQLFFEVATQKAEPSLQFEIQEWLDTGSDFDTVLLRAANEMADPEASAYIQNYESVLNTSANASTGGWRLSKNKIDENSLFIQSQLKYITANSRSVPPTATEVKDGDAEYVRSTLLPTDKSFVGVYSVASQFLLLLKTLMVQLFQLNIIQLCLRAVKGPFLFWKSYLVLMSMFYFISCLS